MCTTARALTRTEAASFVCVPRSLTVNRPATRIARPTLPRPPHPVPTFVTMANAPREGRDGRSYGIDLGGMRSRIFFERWLDGSKQLDPVHEIRDWAQRRGRPSAARGPMRSPSRAISIG
jgi:hypothetical protein